MRRALRIAITVVKWTAIAVVSLFAIIVLINAFDEAPTPEAVALAASPQVAVPDADNAYLALVGFEAPTGMDPVEQGKKKIADYNAKASTDPWGVGALNSLVAEAESGAASSRLKFAGEQNGLCSPFGPNAASIALAHEDEWRLRLDANAELAGRYLATQKLTGFAVTALPGVMQPVPVGGWSSVQQVLVCDAAAHALSGMAPDALTFFEDDLRFWRRVLTGDVNIISEMIATAYLSRNLHLLSSLISTPGFPVEAHAVRLRQMLAPLENPQNGIRRMFANEFTMQAAIYRSLPEAPEWTPPEEEPLSDKVERLLWSKPLAGHFYKPQATLNLAARYFGESIDVANAGPGGFIARRQHRPTHSEEFDFTHPGVVYNPIGKLMVGIARPEYEDYAARVFDLAAYIQLVRAQLEIRLAAIPPERVQSFLAAAGSETRNSYDDKPFIWNAPNGTLSFEPQSKRWREWATSVPVAPSSSAK